MHAELSTQDNLSYSDRPPVIIVGSTQVALERATANIDAAGLRIGAQVLVEGALERLRRQALASAIWIELDQDEPDTGPLFAELNREAAAGRYSVAVAAPAVLIDPVMVHAGDRNVQVLIDPDDAQRSTALAVIAHADRSARISAVPSDRSAVRLRQLSEEVSRIASTLARLSTGPAAASPMPLPPAVEDAPPVSAETVRGVIRARRLRARYFQEDLFADPA
jgi:hypothetical protein